MRGAITVAYLTFLVACGPERGDQGPLTPETEAQLAFARKATISGSVQVVEVSGPTRQDTSVSAEWSFPVDTGWAAYSSQATSSLQSAGFIVTTQDGLVSLSKQVAGDVYRVRIARGESGARPSVAVTFSASPD